MTHVHPLLRATGHVQPLVDLQQVPSPTTAHTWASSPPPTVQGPTALCWIRFSNWTFWCGALYQELDLKLLKLKDRTWACSWQTSIPLSNAYSILLDSVIPCNFFIKVIPCSLALCYEVLTICVLILMYLIVHLQQILHQLGILQLNFSFIVPPNTEVLLCVFVYIELHWFPLLSVVTWLEVSVFFWIGFTILCKRSDLHKHSYLHVLPDLVFCYILLVECMVVLVQW